MRFCKFDKSLSTFSIEGSSWSSLNRATCAKRANQYGSHVRFCVDNQYGSHVGFCVDKHIILKQMVMEIYSRFHGSEKKVSTI